VYNVHHESRLCTPKVLLSDVCTDASAGSKM